MGVPVTLEIGGTTLLFLASGTRPLQARVESNATVHAANGSVAQMIGYDEFGVVLCESSPGFQPFGFAGGLYDSDTKLVRFGARDHDPRTGRWTSRDPSLFAGGTTNLYEYAFNDPLNFADRRGEAAAAVGAGGVLILTGVVAMLGSKWLREHPEAVRQLATGVSGLINGVNRPPYRGAGKTRR